MKLTDLSWVDLHIPPIQMTPENTLNMGQCFNWKRLPLSDEESLGSKFWIGVVDGQPLIVKQLSSTTEVASLLSMPVDPSHLRQTMLEYFQLDDDLPELYGTWSQKCERMRTVSVHLPGVRVVRQDPWECLISFICSSNNNISRISLMLQRLRATYGSFLCTVRVKNDHGSMGPSDGLVIDFNPPRHDELAAESEASDDEGASPKRQPQRTPTTEDFVFPMFSFPTIDALAALEEAPLRSLGVGYRAKFIINSAKLVRQKSTEMGSDWLVSLRRPQAVCKQEPAEAGEETTISSAIASSSHRRYVQQQLLLLPGVGMKVADCVALFSLDQYDVIPVDTHVWSIAVRDYAPELSNAKSLTPTIYEQVGDIFRDMFQRRAGWAHSVLFAAELPLFRGKLPAHLQEEMRQFALDQKKAKALKREAKSPSKPSKPSGQRDESDHASSPVSAKVGGKRKRGSAADVTSTPTKASKVRRE